MPETPSERRLPIGLAWIMPGVIFTLTFLVFLPALEYGFVDWDDRVNILDNPHYRGLAWPNLKWMATTFYMAHYIPLTWFSLGFDYAFWGLNPKGYHLTSLILHSANAVLFYFLIIKLLAQKREISIALCLAAACGALFWAIHPLRVEPVAWVTGRRYVLSGFFALLSLIFYLKAAEVKSVLWVSFLFYVCACLSHEICASLFFVFIILDYYPSGRLDGIAAAGQNQWRRRYVWEKALFLAPAALATIGAVKAHLGYGLLLSLPVHDLPTRAAQAAYALIFYLRKTLAPASLAALYQVIPGRWSIFETRFVLSAAVVFVLTAFSVAFFNRARFILLAWIVYIVLLMPTLGTVGTQSLAYDKFSYMATMPLFVLAGAAFFSVGAGLNRLRRLKAWPGLGLAVYFFTLAAVSRKQLTAWSSTEALWRRVLKVNEASFLAHLNLAGNLLRQNNAPDALKHFQRSLELFPNQPKPYAGIAGIYYDQGKIRQAIRLYQQALVYYSDKTEEDRAYFSNVYNNLGLAHRKLKEMPQALGALFKAVELAPSNVLARVNLGRVFSEMGKHDEAVSRGR